MIKFVFKCDKEDSIAPMFSVTRFPNSTISSKLFPSSASAPHIWKRLQMLN